MPKILPDKMAMVQLSSSDVVLPDELLQHMASFLPRADIIHSTRVSRPFCYSFFQAVKQLPPLLDYVDRPHSQTTSIKHDFTRLRAYTTLSNGYIVTSASELIDEIQIWDSKTGACLLSIYENKPEDERQDLCIWTGVELVDRFL